jgi:hypothetical protein
MHTWVEQKSVDVGAAGACVGAEEKLPLMVYWVSSSVITIDFE